MTIVINDVFHVSQNRFVNDIRCWKVPLDTSNIQRRPRLSCTSETFDWDPALQNSWILHVNLATDRVTPAFRLAKSWVFRFEYMCCSTAAHDALTRFGYSQTEAQLKYGKRLNTWTW